MNLKKKNEASMEYSTKNHDIKVTTYTFMEVNHLNHVNTLKIKPKIKIKYPLKKNKWGT